MRGRRGGENLSKKVGGEQWELQEERTGGGEGEERIRRSVYETRVDEVDLVLLSPLVFGFARAS